MTKLEGEGIEFERRRHETRRGWELIRGSYQNWDSPEGFKEVESLSDDVDKLGDAWHSFNLARLELDPLDDTTSSPQQTCLYLLESRALSLLDAVRAVSMIGRPAAAGIIGRSIYENLLASLLIGFDTGPIDAVRLRYRSDPGDITCEQYADRFLEFGQHGQLMTLEGFIAFEDNNKETEPSGSRHSIESAGQNARTKYKFSPARNSWHPFKGMRAIREHLWPEGMEPAVPRDSLPITYSHWRRLYALCYTEWSHDVHASSLSLSRHELRRDDELNFFLARRTWNPHPLSLSTHCVEVTLHAIAASRGELEIWLRCCLEKGLLEIPSEEE